METKTHRLCMNCIINDFLFCLVLFIQIDKEKKDSLNAYELSAPKCFYFSASDSH